MTIGDRIRERRIEMGLSQIELAERMGLKNKSTVCKLEKGEDNLTTTTVAKYAKALHTTPAVLMGWVEDEPSTDGALDAELIFKFSKLTKEQKKAIMKFIDAFLND